MRRISFVVLFSCLVCFSCFAQQEDITITTYYPSPDGSYQNLDTVDLDVTDTINIGQAGGVGMLNANNANIVADLAVNGNLDINVLRIAGGAFQMSVDGDGDLIFQGGDAYFQNDDGSPSTLFAGGVWYCVNYP